MCCLTTLLVSVLDSLNIFRSPPKAGCNIYLPPPALTGKQLFYLHWSFPVTNVNRQPIGNKEWGVNRAKTDSEELECTSRLKVCWSSLLPDPPIVSRSVEGMWGSCHAKCGSSFHLRTK